jgi:hypothetical protein
MRTDGQTDMTNLIVAFRNLANEPNGSFRFKKGKAQAFPMHITSKRPFVIKQKL